MTTPTPAPGSTPNLHILLRDRFREVFGEPHHSLGHDDHWRLEFTDDLSLNILVNGSPEKPAVWLFEPQQNDNGVNSRLIMSQNDIEEMINWIQLRMKPTPIPSLPPRLTHEK